jgi:hypothetical protein
VTIAARERVEFDIDFQLLRSFGTYRLRPKTKRSVGGSRVSWIFKHGAEVEKLQSNGQYGGRYWICKDCHQKRIKLEPHSVIATGSASYHLEKVHKVSPHGPIVDETQNRQAITNWLPNSSRQSLSAEKWQQKFINWIVHDDITFSQAASERFRDLLLHSGPDIEALLPTANTVRAWIMRAFQERRADVKLSLQKGYSRIALSFDIWTAPNDLMLLGVVGHWIDQNKRLQRALLGLPAVEGHYGKGDLAPALSSVIDLYEIGHKLSAFQMDNADNNDTCLRALAEKYTIDEAEQRMRCFGHVVNLVVKALLFGEGLAKHQKELDGASDHEKLKIWRKKGAIGKLHNLVIYISRSGQRIIAFNKAQQEVAEELLTFFLKLKKDTGVRWNSIYTMIHRALKLEKALTLYCARWQKPKESAYNLHDDQLDQQDWEELRHFEELLKPFHTVTKRVEGHASDGSFGAVWEVLPAFDYLFNKLSKAELEVNDDPSLFTDYYINCINAGFAKLKEYYSLTDRSRIYRAAVALHPGKRFQWFENQWRRNKGGHRDVANAKRAVKLLWHQWLHDLATEPTTSVQTETMPKNSVPSIRHLQDDCSEDEDYIAAFGSYSTVSESSRLRQDKESELDRFMTAYHDITGYEERPLVWWIERGEPLYPTLAGLAFTLFAIPGMSAECERAFSQAKKMVTDERYCLKADVIEADQCVKSWLKSQLVDGSATWRILGEVRSDEDDTADGQAEHSQA